MIQTKLRCRFHVNTILLAQFYLDTKLAENITYKLPPNQITNIL